MPLARAVAAAIGALILGCQAPSLPPWDDLYWSVPEQRAKAYRADRRSCLEETPRVSQINAAGISKAVRDWDVFVACMQDRGYSPAG